MTSARHLLALVPGLFFLAPFVGAAEARGSQACATVRQGSPVPCLSGVASWYGKEHQGRRTASGEAFDRNALTAAHPFLPMQTLVRVVDLKTGRSVTVRINDRGPGHGRAIDLSEAAARSLGIKARGHAQVRIEQIAEQAQ